QPEEVFMYGKQPRFLVVIRRVSSYYVFAGLNLMLFIFTLKSEDKKPRHLNVFVLCLSKDKH
ncbi:hypothetical protein L1D55_27500, partial [Vibrio sp. Isolate22]|uniref:hypothetical protein n=1 Tax=Vibrio sp. Isolate22 TaxID=2908532 RepID=UPI001EFDE1DC